MLTYSSISQVSHSGLVRAIGRWSLAALVVNSIIGSGIFGLPSDVAKLIGTASPWAVLIAGTAMGIIMGCFAEVGSQFSEAGGPYLYARATFGRLIGIEVGWMLWLVRIAAPAATANLLVIYLGEFWPAASQRVSRLIVLTLLIGIIAAINFLGVRRGTRASNLFTIAKLLPLFTIAFAGIIYLTRVHASSPVLPVGSTSSWFKALVLLVFAYGGFETAMTPMAEASNPRRDVAFGLLAGLVVCIVLYTTIQWSAVSILPDPAHSQRPLADLARLILGDKGAVFVAIGALISVYGYLTANMLSVPRLTFALAERGDFPAIFAAIHPRFRTPYVSILVYALLLWLLAILGSFSWNATLSAVARLFYYGVVCAALPVLRRRQPHAAEFRLPAGTVLASIGIAVCGVLVTQVDVSKSVILLVTALIGLANWLVVRRRNAPQGPIQPRKPNSPGS
jgi:basic amino acid/polyamine antiporter, APA family